MKFRPSAPCDTHALDILEAELRIELPKRYRQWLIETNGGIAEGQPYFLTPHNPRSESEVLRGFFGVSPSHPNHDIPSIVRDHLWILRQDHLPIGWTEGSGFLSIELTSWSERVYFFDICDEGEPNGLRTPHFVAESIDDLTAALRYD